MATPSNVVTPEPNLIDTVTMKDAQIREIDFAERFGESLKKLIEALGVTRKVAKEAGTVLKTYKATGTLVDGTTAKEGEIIPLSEYKVVPVNYKEIELKKYRKATTAEAIVKYGWNQSVNMTTDRMLKDVQKGIRKDFFDFMLKTEGTGEASGVGLKGALAQTWGQLQVKFEDDEIEAVYFVNPLDIADYLEGADVTTQTAFGMTYIENFLGLGTVFMNTSVTKGTVIGTAKENIVMYYITVNGADLGSAFNFTTDESGYVGIHETADYDNLTHKATVMDGIEFFAERIDGVILGTITEVVGE